MARTAAVPANTTAPPPLKRGVTTTEFWLTVTGALLTLLAGLGVIGPDWANKHEPIVQALALLASVLGPGLYALSRGVAKHGHQLAVADVLTALITSGVELPKPTPAKRSNDAGFAIIGLIGAIVAAVGGIWLILGAVHHRFDVIGLILLVIGLIILYFDGGVGPGVRRL